MTAPASPAIPFSPREGRHTASTGKTPAMSRGVTRPAAVWSLAFWRSYATTMRPHLLFVSGITGIVGLAFAPPVAPYLVLPAALVFFLSYGFGQALTDCFQLDTDSLAAPERPLVRGEIRRTATLLVSLVGLLACGVTLGLYHLLNLPLAAIAVLGLATYTGFKRRWWAGPLYNAWIVAVLGVIGYLSGLGAAGAKVTWSPTLLAALAAVFFGYANFVLAGYAKDLSADRATGYHTLPVVFGLPRSAAVSHVLALAALLSAAGALLPLARAPATPSFASLAFFAAAIVATLLGQHRLHRLVDERLAYRAIVPVVHAYILALTAVAVARRPSWAVPLAVFYAAFVYAMARRPSRHQV